MNSLSLRSLIPIRIFKMMNLLIFHLLTISPALAVTAVSQSVSTSEDNPKTIQLRGGSSSATYRITENPTYGTVSITGSVAVYSPSSNYNGTDQFSFRVRESSGEESSDGLISISISSVNDSPTLVAPSEPITTSENNSVSYSLNASDVDGTLPTCEVVGAVIGGSVTFGEGASACRFTFNPQSNFNGNVQFSAKASDGTRTSSTVTVDIVVTAVNEAPVLGDQSVSVNEDVTSTIRLRATDGDRDSLSYRIVRNPGHGTASISGEMLTYTPNANFNGTDTLRVVANDGIVDSAGALITYSVNAVNDAPSMTGSTINLPSNHSYNSISLSASDVDGDTLTFRLTGRPTHGSLVATDGTFISSTPFSATSLLYTPEYGFSGTDTFTISVNDGRQSTSASFTLNVSTTSESNAISVSISEPTSASSLRDLQGVISGPLSPFGSSTRDYTAQFQDVGITAIRNNDLGGGELDLESMFNCTGNYGGTCEGDRANGSEFPCWATCSPTSSTDPSLIFSPKTSSDPDHDGYMNAIISGGFSPFFRLGGSMNDNRSKLRNLAPNDSCDGETDGYSFRGAQGSRERSNLIEASRYVFQHFQDRFGSEYFPYVDIHTEYVNEGFWDEDSSSGCGESVNTNFVRYFAGNLSSLHRFSPSVKVGGPGILGGETTLLRGDLSGVHYQFLNELYSLRSEFDVRLDFIDTHIFEADHGEYFYSVPKALKDLLMGRSGSFGEYSWNYESVPWAGTGFFDSTEVIIGAYHTNPQAYSGNECSKRMNGGLSAALQASFWMAMQASDLVTKAFWYRGVDQGNYDSTSESSSESCSTGEGTTGILYSQPDSMDSTHSVYKPVANAFKLESQMLRSYPNRLQVAVGSNNPNDLQNTDAYGKVWILAGKSTVSNSAALLVTNTSSEPWTISPTIATGSTRSYPLTRYRVEQYLLDDSHDGRSVSSRTDKGGPNSVTIPAESVMLIVVSR